MAIILLHSPGQVNVFTDMVLFKRGIKEERIQALSIMIKI
jgi:hypothetical protein